MFLGCNCLDGPGVQESTNSSFFCKHVQAESIWQLHTRNHAAESFTARIVDPSRAMSPPSVAGCGESACRHEGELGDVPRPLALRRSLGRAAPANILAPFAVDGLRVHVRGHVYSALHYAWVLGMAREALFSLFPGKKSVAEGAGVRVCEHLRGRYRHRHRGRDGRMFDPLGLFLSGQLVGAVLLSSACGFGLESLYGVLGAEFVLGAWSRLVYREVRPDVVVEALDRVFPPRLCARLGRRPAAAHGWLHDNVRDVSVVVVIDLDVTEFDSRAVVDLIVFHFWNRRLLPRPE